MRCHGDVIIGSKADNLTPLFPWAVFAQRTVIAATAFDNSVPVGGNIGHGRGGSSLRRTGHDSNVRPQFIGLYTSDEHPGMGPCSIDEIRFSEYVSSH